MILHPRHKLAATALLFAVAIALVAAAAALGESAPLFAAWVPTVLAGWILARPEPGDAPRGVPADAETTVAAGRTAADGETVPPDRAGADANAAPHRSRGAEPTVPRDAPTEAPADGAREGDAHPG